jgi:hypothetical protein
MTSAQSYRDIGVSISRTSNEQKDIYYVLCKIPQTIRSARILKLYPYGLRYEIIHDDGESHAFPFTFDKNIDETFHVMEHKFIVVDGIRYTRIVVTSRDVEHEADYEIAVDGENQESVDEYVTEFPTSTASPQTENICIPRRRGRPRKITPDGDTTIPTPVRKQGRKRKVVASEDDECNAVTYDGDDVIFIDDNPTTTKRQKVQSIIKCKPKSIFCKPPVIRKISDGSYVAECEFPCVNTLQRISLMITDDKMHLLDGKGSKQTQMFSFKLPQTIADRIVDAEYSFEDEVVDGNNITSLKIYIECEEE